MVLMRQKELNFCYVGSSDGTRGRSYIRYSFWDQGFGKVKEKVLFLYLELNLGDIYYLKVIVDA